MENIENDSSYANLQEPSIVQQLAQSKANAELAALQHALQQAREELSRYQSKHQESKRAAKAKYEETIRGYQAKLHSSESERLATEERMRVLERAKQSSAKELENNLAQTISLYSLISQHQNTIEQQRIKCEYSDAQFQSTVSKLKSAEKEMVRLRLLMEKEHDSNERHIQAQKGQFAMKQDECLVLTSKLDTLQKEYTEHRKELENQIEKLNKERSILEAVNFELHSEKEKNYQLTRENTEMKQDILKKANVEGKLDAAIQQIQGLSETINKLELERAKWTGERRDLDHSLGDITAQLKNVTAERDASQIECQSLQRQLEQQANEQMRRLEMLHESNLKKQTGLQEQISERDQAHAHALKTIEGLEKDISTLRASEKALLEQVAGLEQSVRDAGVTDSEKSDQVKRLEAEIDALKQELTQLSQHQEKLSTTLSSDQAKLIRTQVSREELVEKLDANYSNSYLAQIFQKWKAEYKLQQQTRTAQETATQLQQVQEELSSTVEEKKATDEKLLELTKQFSNDLATLKTEFAQEKSTLIHSHQQHEKQLREQWEKELHLTLGRAKLSWEDEQKEYEFKTKEEQREREKRIAEEREKIRAEMEEARRLELEELKSKEVSHSIARRPSVQSLVGHVVEQVLEDHPHSPLHRTRHSHSHSPTSYHHSRRHRSRDPHHHHRHHHHHHVDEISPRHHHHHYPTTSSTTGESSRPISRPRSSSPPSSLPPPPQPFQLPHNYAPFVQQLTEQSLQQQQTPHPRTGQSTAAGSTVNQPIQVQAKRSTTGSRAVSARTSKPISSRSSASNVARPHADDQGSSPKLVGKSGTGGGHSRTTSQSSLATGVTGVSRKSGVNRNSLPPGTKITIPPLPLPVTSSTQSSRRSSFSGKGLKEAANEAIVAAGSPLDTYSPPVPTTTHVQPSGTEVAAASSTSIPITDATETASLIFEPVPPNQEHELAIGIASGLESFLQQANAPRSSQNSQRSMTSVSTTYSQQSRTATKGHTSSGPDESKEISDAVTAAKKRISAVRAKQAK